MSAGCTTPARDAGGGTRTPNGLCPRRSRRRAFAITPPQRKLFLTPKANSGGRTRTPTACSKDRRPAFRRPRTEVKRTRHDSNVRPQAPQACALIRLSYGSEGKGKAEAVRVERTGARARRARRLSTPLHYLLCDASERFGGRCGSRTRRSRSGSDSFRDCLACPCPTFRA